MRKKKIQPKAVAATIVGFACDLMMAAAFVIMSIAMYNMVVMLAKYGK